jgi:tetratricopeptide (TPR) repeat protein
MLTVHRLVQTVLRDTLPITTKQRWIHSAIHAILVTYPESPAFINWPALERLLPHALACVTWIEQMSLTDPTFAALLNQVGYYLYVRKRYTEAEPVLKHALAMKEQQLGDEHLDTATGLNNLALLYHEQERYVEAEFLYQRALPVVCWQRVLPRFKPIKWRPAELKLLSINAHHQT